MSDRGQVLYVGAPCAGYRERGRWACRCRARTPRGCKTETAQIQPRAGGALAFELLKRDPKVARQSIVIRENMYAKVRKLPDRDKFDRERVKYAKALLAAVRAVAEGEGVAWKKLLLMAGVPAGNASKSALRALVTRGLIFKHGSHAWTTYRPNRKNQEPYREP